MGLPVRKILVTTGCVIIYFRRRKLYVDDKSFTIKFFRNKSITIYTKDIINTVGIASSSVVIFSLAEKAYLYIKTELTDRGIRLRLPVAVDESQDLPALESPVDAVEIVKIENVPAKSGSNFKIPIRGIFYFGLAVGFFYLSNRIELPENIIDVSAESVDAGEKIPTLTTKLSWWDKIGLDPKLIEDMSDEGTYGQITRPTVEESGSGIPPIVSSNPRRIVVILFTVLTSLGLKLNSIDVTPDKPASLPVWFYSPAYYLLKLVYNQINK